MQWPVFFFTRARTYFSRTYLIEYKKKRAHGNGCHIFFFVKKLLWLFVFWTFLFSTGKMIWLKHFITFMYLHTYLVLFYTLIMCLHFRLFFLFLQVISEIIETCRAHDFTDVILVHEHRGVPDGIIISHLPFGPTAYFGLLNVVSGLILTLYSSKSFLLAVKSCRWCPHLTIFMQVTRHDIKDKKSIGTMPEAYPHLIFDKFSTKVIHNILFLMKGKTNHFFMHFQWTC